MAPPAGWISLEGHLHGVLAVAISASISLFCIFGLVSFIGALLWRHYSESNMVERREKKMRNKAIRFLASTHGLLFIDLLVGDLLQAIGFAMNYSWFRHEGLPPSENPNALCTAQAILIQIGDTASCFSSLIISINLLVIVVFRRHPSVKGLWCVIAGQWILVGILAGIGLRWLGNNGIPFYGDSGSWCWIQMEYNYARLWLHYFWVFVIAFLDLVIYSIIGLYLAVQSRRTSSKVPNSISNLSGVVKLMPLYALSYIVTILPLSAYRAAAMAGNRWSTEFQLGAGFVFTLSGAVNCIIYATTRNIISAESVGALRRGSQTVSQSGLNHTSRSKLQNFFFVRRATYSPSSKGTFTEPPSSHVHVQVETEISLPGLPSTPSPTSLTFDQKARGGGGMSRLEYEREKLRDWEREKEMEKDRKERERGEGERPFASLREVEERERERRMSDPEWTESSEGGSTV